MKKWIIVFLATPILYSCSGNKGGEEQSGTDQPVSMVEDEEESAPAVSDEGIGKFKNVELPPTIDAAKVAAGQKIVDVKCASCHKLSDEKLVGPGWKGVTTRRKPAWILNFVTNVEEMLDKDPEAQAQLEICMVRMPNQNLSDNDAYAILEFMRDNDAK